MTITAFFLIVCSAILHASWNLIAKKNKMSISFYLMMSIVANILWSNVMFWTPVPIFDLPWKFYLYAFLSVTGDQMLYCFGLMWAYRRLEMSTAYPMMRSLPLLLTALVTTLTGWGEPLSLYAKLGMLIVFFGCLMVPMQKFSDLHFRNYMNIGMLFILLVACGTTCYTIFDSQAQKVLAESVSNISKPMLSLSFYSMRCFMLFTLILICVLLMPSERREIRKIVRTRNFRPCLAGICASCTYIMVLIAMNYVSNVTYVQAFRQIGLLFGMFGGIFILKERFTMPKLCGVLLIISGLVLSVF